MNALVALSSLTALLSVTLLTFAVHRTLRRISVLERQRQQAMETVEAHQVFDPLDHRITPPAVAARR